MFLDIQGERAVASSIHIYLCAFETFISSDKKFCSFIKFKVEPVSKHAWKTSNKTNIIEKIILLKKITEEKYPIPHWEYPR